MKDFEKFLSSIFSLMEKSKVYRWLIVELLLKFVDDLGLLYSSQNIKLALEEAQAGGDFFSAILSMSSTTTPPPPEVYSVTTSYGTFDFTYGSLLRIAWFIINVLDVLDWNVVLKALDVVAKSLPSSKI